MGLNQLIIKYSTPGPRYTSYPTAPQWSETVGSSEYREALGRVDVKDPIALYAHLPFCEKLCYYCGCNIQITGDKERSRPYVQRVLQELNKVAGAISGRPRLAQISWGGGTPTFLTLEEIRSLHLATLEYFDVEPSAEVSIEIDPRVTTAEQLSLLRSLGFNRTSLGVQDFEPRVQQAINRIQPAEATAETLELCRSLGYDGVNFDLIYGLPFQTLETFKVTVAQVIQMRPDRIALYNYARLPSLLKHQAILEKFPMPSAEERVDIFTMAFDALTLAGYQSIGMDHFALKQDTLAKALESGALHRNFMGYAVKHGAHLIGVGASAIGEVGGGFFQGVRKPADYEKRIEAGDFATLRGLVLSEDDLRRKWVIQNLMCRFEVVPEQFESKFGVPFAATFESELQRLNGFYEDGILEGNLPHLKVSRLGQLFVRNVAMVFDAYLGEKKATYSKTV